MPRPRTLLVTTATGTVGSAVVEALRHAPARPNVPELDAFTVLTSTRHHDRVDATHLFFDLTHPEESAHALQRSDAAFLLMPPGLGDAPAQFKALLDAVPTGELPHLVFMSVQGAESRSFLPHAKVEKVIRERVTREPGPKRFTILRPSYFMQNLENVFLEDIRQRREIVVPAGEAKFVWVDVADIGRAAAAVLLDPDPHAGKAYAITGTDVVGFTEVAQRLSRYTTRPVTYRSPNPLSNYLRLRRGGTDGGMAIAQTLIHFVERFTAVAPVSADYTYLTGEKASGLDSYLQGLAKSIN